MITKVMMPQVGQDLEIGRIVHWIKKEGDHVKKGDALCEVETEKAVVEVPAPAEGVLIEILHPDNAEVKILTEIGLIGDSAESLPIVNFEGSLAKEKVVPAEPAKTAINTTSNEKTHRIRISPKAKKIAEENKLLIEKIHGSGPRGRIVEKDVRNFLENQTTGSSLKTTSSSSGQEKISPLSKIRKVTAQRLQHSKQNIPHFYISLSVDMTSAIQKQKDLNEKLKLPKDESVSINDFIVKACALSIRDFPEMNSTFSGEGIHLSQEIDIGVAVAVEDGLVVPVIENCDKLGIKDLSDRIRQAVQSARSGKQLITRPGRFTISNLGMYNIDDFAAIINPPEVGILAVGSIKKQLVVQADNSFCVQDQMKITLSVDHRVVDGVLAAKFLNRIKEILETVQEI
jgi:pyruvate dehydrogenase E2 component (dihydrolipoamide acetyltransferase)